MKLCERIGPELRVVGSADAPILIDPQDRRHVYDVIALGEYVLGVDQARVSGTGPLDERPRVVATAIECDRDRNEPQVSKLFVE